MALIVLLFRRANFDAMRTELDYQSFEQPIVRNNGELGFEIFITESMMQAEDTSQKDEPPSTIHRGSTMKKLSQNTLKLKDKSKEL